MKWPLHAASFVAAACLLLVASSASATDTSSQVCIPVYAELSASFYSLDCTSAVGLCTSGTVTTLTGHPIGHMEYTAGGLGGAPVGEASIVTPAIEPATTWSYAGQLVISTAIGQVTTSDVGVLDTVSGAFTEFNRIESGTGYFSDATGTLFISGFAFPDGSGFAGDIRGTICIPESSSAWTVENLMHN